MNRFNSSHGDDLSDLLGGAPSTTDRAPVQPPAHYRPREVGVTEPCKACRGSGQFRSYSGRLVGPCFKCKGKGTKTFLTSTESRDRAKARREEVKVDRAAANLRDFAAAEPEVWAWMNGNTFGFAVSLRQSVERFGSLTANQINAARSAMAKLAAKKEEAQARKDAAPTISMDKIEAAFATARANGLNKIKVRFVGLAFSPAPAASQNAGALYVKRGGEYLGKIAGGKFFASRACDAEASRLILEVAADPKAAAKAYGIQTGSCSCCGRELTDPQSVEAGIGPICATKFGW